MHSVWTGRQAWWKQMYISLQLAKELVPVWTEQKEVDSGIHSLGLWKKCCVASLTEILKAWVSATDDPFQGATTEQHLLAWAEGKGNYRSWKNNNKKWSTSGCFPICWIDWTRDCPWVVGCKDKSLIRFLHWVKLIYFLSWSAISAKGPWAETKSHWLTASDSLNSSEVSRAIVCFNVRALCFLRKAVVA